MVKNLIYNLLIDNVTNYCYMNCLNYFPHNATILDVGIGNGIMLKNYHPVITSKDLRITGIDINKSYIRHSARLIKTFKLENHIKLAHTAIENFTLSNGGGFDFILFSMSFMLLRDQRLILEKVKELLNPGGKLVFFQTMFKDRSQIIEFVKPKIKYLTTVDFGRVTYERDFFPLLNRNNYLVLHDRLIKREWFKGEYRMIVASPLNGT